MKNYNAILIQKEQQYLALSWGEIDKYGYFRDKEVLALLIKVEW